MQISVVQNRQQVATPAWTVFNHLSQSKKKAGGGGGTKGERRWVGGAPCGWLGGWIYESHLMTDDTTPTRDPYVRF